MNHKWNIQKDVCLRCGVVRERKTSKLLMAITDFPPYNHYLYEQYFLYHTLDGNVTTKRPDCKIMNGNQTSGTQTTTK
jgi:hypothetical protein